MAFPAELPPFRLNNRHSRAEPAPYPDTGRESWYAEVQANGLLWSHPMGPVEQHAHEPDVSFDGGDLDCGGGLLLLIRRHIDPLDRGGLLEILSTDSTVEVELPA